MKRIYFHTDQGANVIGVVAKTDDKWEKLVPEKLRPDVHALFCKNDLKNTHGFFVSDHPDHMIVIFTDTGGELKSTLAHEAGHVQRHIVWQIGDKLHKDGDEGYARTGSDIFEQFVELLRKKYGMVDTITWKPNARQKKREIK